MEPTNQNTNIIGIDLGLIDSIVTSDAEFVKNPKVLSKYEKKIKQMQRDLARKKKGSNNYNKLKNKLAKKHKKVRNVRTDYLHKLSTNIAIENQVVIMENLNIKNMVKNHCLAKRIHDAGWGRLVSMIKYKCGWQGKTFLLVNPRNTTTDCNVCGHRNKSLTLDDRTWTCERCGTKHQRDHNASLVIRDRGIKILKESGHDFSTFKYAWEISSSTDGEPKNQLDYSSVI
jgi:putative transposase